MHNTSMLGNDDFVEKAFRSHFYSVVFGLIFGVVSLIVTLLFVWNTLTQPIGGQFWIVIKIVATFVSGLLALKVGSIIGYFLSMAVVTFLSSR